MSVWIVFVPVVMARVWNEAGYHEYISVSQNDYASQPNHHICTRNTQCFIGYLFSGVVMYIYNHLVSINATQAGYLRW
jgi:hypothetical protein